MNLTKRSVPSSSRTSAFQPKKLGLFLLAAVLALLTIFPILFMVSSAFKGSGEIFNGGLIPAKPTLENFTYVLTQVPFLHYMFNSFIVAAIVTVAALFLHSMAAYALARLRFPGRDLIFFGFFATILVSMPVIVVPLFILVRKMGLINSFPGVFLPLIFYAFPLFLLRQFYLGLPRELEESALVDGCGYWRLYWSIILPISRPIMAALAIFLFLGAWNAFLWPLTIIQNQNLWVIQVAMASFQGQYSSSWNYIMAASTVAAFPTVILFLFFQRQIIESIKTSGFK